LSDRVSRRRKLPSLLAGGAALAVAVGGCGGNSRHLATNGLGTFALTSAQQHGEILFKSTCSSCHTLSAAGATGKVGPNLDMLRPPAPAVTATIASGLGAMPAHLLEGSDAQAVADYVAAVTAH
jgi:mono/diheme cytochrome c family protein